MANQENETNAPTPAPASDPAAPDSSTPAGDAIDRIVEAAAAENAKAGESVADRKVRELTEAAAAETERGRAERRQVKP